MNLSHSRLLPLNFVLSFVLNLLSACASTLPQIPEEQDLTPPQTDTEAVATRERSARLLVLPGMLNKMPVFYSNRPELLKTPGEILNSTDLPEMNSLTGSFSIFAHHVVETAPFDFSGFRLGLLVRPASSQATEKEKAVSLTLHNAFISRTQPDAPFITTAPLLTQTKMSKIVSGPGDAMAWARLNTQDLYPENSLATKSLPATFTFDREILVADIEVPTFPLGLGIIGERNGLSAWLDVSSTAPVSLRWVAIKTTKPSAGLADYQDAAKIPAGPSELPATVYDPQGAPPSGVFRFGRVAGVVQGADWNGVYRLSSEDIDNLKEGLLLAWPVASTYLKAWGGQNQSAPLLARQADSAVQSHGNYGVAYHMAYTLANPDDAALELQWRWTQPTSVSKNVNAKNILSYDPKTQIVFRGSIRVETHCQEDGKDHDPKIQFYHLQVKQGHWHAPFYAHSLPPKSECRLLLDWVYPPDAIPPQMLSVEKKP
jgi:hypothetical protein